MAIQSFGDKMTEEFYLTGQVTKKVKWKSVIKVALRKLDMLNFAFVLEDLKVPPNNRLEKLVGDKMNFYSIRINDKWRIIFKWSDLGPIDVSIIDYH